jgi:hypothetical protein
MSRFKMPHALILSVAGLLAGCLVLAQAPRVAQAVPIDPLTLLPAEIIQVQGPVMVGTATDTGIISLRSISTASGRPALPFQLDKRSFLRMGVGVPIVVGGQASAVRLFVGTRGADLLGSLGNLAISTRETRIAPPVGIGGRSVTLTSLRTISLTGGNIFGTSLVTPQAKVSLVSGGSTLTGLSAAPTPVPLPPGVLLFASGLLSLAWRAYRRSHALH